MKKFIKQDHTWQKDETDFTSPRIEVIGRPDIDYNRVSVAFNGHSMGVDIDRKELLRFLEELKYFLECHEKGQEVRCNEDGDIYNNDII